jgi:hypothetical protein
MIVSAAAMRARFDQLREAVAPLQDWSNFARDLEGAVDWLRARPHEHPADEHAALEALQDHVRTMVEWMRAEVTRDFPVLRRHSG